MKKIKNMNTKEIIRILVIVVLALVALDILGTIATSVVSHAPLTCGILIGIAGCKLAKKLKAKKN